MRGLAFLLIFGVTGAAILVSLGVWQVQRLAWKEAMVAEIDTRISAEPSALPHVPGPLTDRFTPVRVEGSFLPGELHVLVSVKRVGPGYRIISPFETVQGRRILIDRGFVPSEAKNDPRDLGATTVTGNLHWPEETDSFTPETDLATNTWFARDVASMAMALDTEPVLLIASSRTDPGVTPLPVDTSVIPNDHLEYAITWFSLAAIWVAMTGAFLWRNRATAKA
jgi:surfeit locus 1 family protein